MSIDKISPELLEASRKAIESRVISEGEDLFIKAFIYKGEGINISRRGRGMSAPIILKVNGKEIGEFKNQAAAEKAGKQYIDGGMKESIDEATATGKPMKEKECGCGEECDCEDCKKKHQEEEKCKIKEDINDFLNSVLSEKAPPDEKIKKWLEDPKVQASFKDQYGDKYKEVMFGKAWKMYDDKQEEKGNE